MIASTTHLEKPVITNPLISWAFVEIDGTSIWLHCTECRASETVSDQRDAEDWADSHLCPWAFCYCGFTAGGHVDGMHIAHAVEPTTVIRGE